MNDTWTGSTPVGGDNRRRPARTFEILAKDFTDATQGEPVRVFWGRVRVAGVAMTPIFGFRSTPVYTQVGK